MKRQLLISLFCIATATAFAQNSITKEADGMVTVNSRGNDVRMVVHDLFSQLGKNYILEPNVRFQTLYLSLKGVEFEEALFQICRLAELKFDVQNGIFYVNKKEKPIEKPVPKPEVKAPEVKKPEPKPIVPAEPKGTYPGSVYAKRVTTRFEKIDLRDLMADIARQTGLKLEVDSSVPKYKIDAYLNNTSLKYALDVITNAAGLRYRLTDRMSIEILPTVVAHASSSSKSDSQKSGH